MAKNLSHPIRWDFFYQNRITYMLTVLLLLCSNTFMTFAWYYHLQQKGWPLWKAILLSWLIAFIEYCFAVPANRIGYASGLNGYQLKMIQEVVT